MLMQSDFQFINGNIVNVFSGEILKQNIGVSKDRIIYVGPSLEAIGPNTRVIDVQGDYIIPGFFDAYAHADLFCNPFSYANYVLTRGTTCLFNAGCDLAIALGSASFMKIMCDLADSYLSVYTGVPAASPRYPGIEGEDLWSEADLKWAMTFENVLSLSEITPYLKILKGDKTMAPKLALAKRRGRLIEGYSTTGANDEELNVLARTGVTSCHGSFNSDEVLERIRLGYYVMLRHGSVRQDLPQIVEAVEKLQGFDTSRIMLVTDGVFPDHLISWGNMDQVVTEVIAQGIDPIRAIQMATINPARYFRLDHQLGAVAPGRLAHLLIVSSLDNPIPRFVMAKGTPVFEEGRLMVSDLLTPRPTMGRRPFKIGEISADTFRIAKSSSLRTVPVIRIVDQTVTEMEDVQIPESHGFYRPEGDILSVFLMSRNGTRKGNGFLKGFCPKLGGIASSIAHETHGLLVLGQKEDDMALAAHDVLKMDGGISLAQGGKIRARIPLPLGGVCSLEGIPKLAAQIQKMHGGLGDLGCPLEYALWTLVVLSSTSIPRLRITYDGVYDVKEGKIIFS